jgi:hypothetical protein
VLFDDLASDIADVLVAHAGIIRTLRRREPAARESEWSAVLEKEILLFESEPGVRIIRDRCAGIGRMRRLAVRHHHLAHDESAVLARAVGIHRDRLQNAVGALPFRLLSRAAVEAPVGQFFELREATEFLDLRLAAKVRHGLITIEPDVFQFVFGHREVS